MTVGELVDILKDLDQDRMAYVQDIDGTVQPVSHIVDMAHTNLPDGITIPDDVAILSVNTFEQTADLNDE